MQYCVITVITVIAFIAEEYLNNYDTLVSISNLSNELINYLHYSNWSIVSDDVLSINYLKIHIEIIFLYDNIFNYIYNKRLPFMI